jgi:LysM repeat protein
MVEAGPRGQRTGDLPTICPFLATDGGTWRAARPLREHRCSAVSPPVPLAPDKQRRLCLGDAHSGCATYIAALEDRSRAAETGSPAQRARSTRPLARMSPVVLDQRRFDMRIPAFRADRTSGQAILVGVLAIALAVIVLGRPSAEPGVAGPSGTAGFSPAPARTGVATDAAVDVPTRSPVATPAPSPTFGGDPVATASPGATAPAAGASNAPAPTPSPPASAIASEEPVLSGATYAVQRGDSLFAIAARFGTTTQLLVKLNGITDPRKLRIGQVLKLP